MLFSSFPFLFGYLPLALLLTFWVGRHSRPAAKLVLTVLSFGFYAWWRPVHLPLLLGSILFNYYVGARIQRQYALDLSRSVRRWLVFGLTVDIGLLGWFKYANFVADNVNLALGAHIALPKIILPLAISFFTFQKVAYLIDSAQGDAKKMSLLDFGLFASFFPQLISGPIVHYKEIVPQIQGPLFGRWISRNFMIGLVIFAIGLFKKAAIADPMSVHVDPLYAAAAAGGSFTLLKGWLAALTYTIQLYFDFSGYSDMAIGLARMFGILLPLNFHSPLRAVSIIEYWRRWHMTLQRFLTSYLFQPIALPLNRRVAEQGLGVRGAFVLGVVVPTFVTFVISGIWHGAGWTFIVWGMMHAVYVSVNDAWRTWKNRRRRALRKLKQTMPEPGAVTVGWYHVVTLLAVVFGNVMFRAHGVNDALAIWGGMIGAHGVISAPDLPLLSGWLLTPLIAGFAIIFLMPNTQQIMGRYNPAANWRDWQDKAPALLRWTWKPNAAGIGFAGVALFFGIILIQRGAAVFLYFNF